MLKHQGTKLFDRRRAQLRWSTSGTCLGLLLRRYSRISRHADVLVTAESSAPILICKHLLSGAAEGDLLLVDLNLAQGAPDDVETLRKKEPSLSNGALDDIMARWLSGPIRRYAEDVTKVDTFVRLDPYCPIPGSYALEFVASCHLGKTQRKEFALVHARRYQVEPLSGALRSIGWATVSTLKFGGTSREPTHALMLFQRMRRQ